MIDIFNLPQQSDLVSWFPGTSSPTFLTGREGWSTWIKPRGINQVAILCIGSGGGGGGGEASDSSCGGGGGGGSASYTNYLYPAWALPDQLYVFSPVGGAGGNGGTTSLTGQTGGTGARSVVSIYPSSVSVDNFVAISGNTGGGGGGGGTTSAGAGGAAGTITSFSNVRLSYVAQWNPVPGIIGQAGGTAVNRPDYGQYTTTPILGGTGGAGKSSSTTLAYNGGTYNGSLAIAGLGVIRGGTGNTTTSNADTTTFTGGASPNGGNGFMLPHLRYFFGGTGGGSRTSTSQPGGRGGAGCAWGTGGGGGGAGRLITPGGGRGGNGGPGLVIIACW